MKQSQVTRVEFGQMSKAEVKNSWTGTVSDYKADDKNSLFLDFSQNSTVHGLRKTTEKRHGKFRRCFSVLVFMGMLTGLLYTLFTQIVLIMSYPSLTQQYLEFRSKLPFPAVTLCNLNQFKKSKLGYNEVSKRALLATSDYFTEGNIDWNDPLWNFTISAEDSARLNSQMQYFSHSIDETLNNCTWNSKRYKCKEIFVSKLTDFGMCYTFNGLTSDNDTPRESVHSGSKYGLTVVVDIKQEEYLLSSNTDAAGLRVLLHDPTETPLVEGKGFDVGPGTATKASIRMTRMTNLPPPYKSHDDTECRDMSTIFQNTLKYFDRYDHQACVYECRLNYITATCGCRNIFDRGDEPICHPRVGLECYLPQFEKFTQEDKYKDCSCPIPCEMKLFDAAVSTFAYPSLVLMEQVNELNNINITESRFRRNNLKLTLAYDRFFVEEIRQVPEFTFESIMSTLGGQLGIYIGASLITVLELLEFGLEILIVRLLRTQTKTTPGKM